MNNYDVGDRVRLSAEFTVSGADTDPTAVTLQIKDPSGTVTTLTYGTDAALKRDSEGKFYYDLDITMHGTWVYRFAGTETAAAAEERVLYVRASAIVPT